jgi:integrase
MHWEPKRAPLPISDLALRSQTDGATLTLKAGRKSAQVVKKLAPGIYTHGKDAYRFFARVRTKLQSHIFRPPIPLSLTGLKEAYRQWRQTLIDGPPRPPTHRGTFAADIHTYLTRVSAMPTIKERIRHLDLWAAALGRERPRASISATEIDVVLQGWLAAGLAPQTVKLRRGALAHVWSILDGKHAPNPVKGSQRPVPPPAEPRDVPLETAQAIFAAMRPSQSKIRLWVIATTGLPHKQLGKLKPTDVDFVRMAIRVTPRRKGKGAAGGWRPIGEAAMEALTAFDRANLYGPFSPSTMHRAFKLACSKAGVGTHFTPYGFRHSFGTWVQRQSGDTATTAWLLGHASLKTAERYAMSAQMAVAQRAVDALQLPEGFGAKVDATAKPRVTPKSHTPAAKSLRARSSGG